MVGGKPKIAAKSPAPASTPDPAEQVPAGAGRKRILILVLVVLVVLGGGAGYWFVLGPGSASSAEAEVEPEPEPGKVQTVESFSLNLAGGRYLRLGLGLQLSAEVLEDIDTSKAVDRALTLFSGRPLEEVSSPEGRTALKDELTRLLKEAYHGEVIAVYFTDYVTQ